MKDLASKQQVGAHANAIDGGLAAHSARLKQLEAQLQQAGSFLDALPQSRLELGAALGEIQERKACEQAQASVQVDSRLLEVEIGSLLLGDAAAFAELRTHVAVQHVPETEAKALRETVLGVRDGLLGQSDALSAEVAALRAEQARRLALGLVLGRGLELQLGLRLLASYVHGEAGRQPVGSAAALLTMAIHTRT